ncbi:2-hydroxyacid dehydrogenase [Arenibaculum sp.]|uniref:2-hydroxyacid dehydrogenase n=1 Tax=Arenibaculum sp. TaxID=2865862 RepID=UPI002E163F5B|nr:2-hydroxyacid dehydrogenase [Arenibaculum sp.]
MTTARPAVAVAARLGPPLLEALERTYETHHLWRGDAVGGQEAARVRALVTSGTVGADAATLARFPNLGLVANFGVGYDAIDVAAARAAGIAIAYTPDMLLIDDVADLAMGLLIAVVRRISAGDRFVRRGDWLRSRPALTGSLGGRTLGIVGFGRIGAAIARRAEASRMTVEYHGRRPKPDLPYRWHADPASLAQASDFLVLACPGGEETRRLVDARVIDALGPAGVLVNVARGTVVDEAALVAALEEGRLGGAGLDVFEDEPNVPEALLARDDVVLSPHLGGGTLDAREAMGRLLLDNLAAWFEGRPLPTPIA